MKTFSYTKTEAKKIFDDLVNDNSAKVIDVVFKGNPNYGHPYPTDDEIANWFAALESALRFGDI